MSGFGKKTTPESEKSVIRNEPEIKFPVYSKMDAKYPIFQTKDYKDAPLVLEFKERVFDLLIKQIDLNAASKMSRPELRGQIEKYLFEYAEEMKVQINYKELQHIVDDIINDMVGLGPLEILLNNKNVNDIMVNAPNQVYIERKGILQLTDVTFRNEKHVFQIAQRIANQIGRRIDESSPMVDARLKDGSRVNIIIPPISLEGTTISIRKFSNHSIHLQDMVVTKNLSQKMFEFLKLAAFSRMNIIISGGTGAGKTTLLNALSELIDPRERIVSIEDAAELKLMQPHVVRLESRPSNIEGEGTITIRDLVKNALRMRPDRIIIGECRGAEAFDMLQAMNTGHDGSMSTLHSNSSKEAVNRLENMVIMSGYELPNEAIKDYVTAAIDIIIQIARMRDGVRRIVQVTEVIDYDKQTIHIQDIFTFQHTSSLTNEIEGKYVFHEISLKLKAKITEAGLEEEFNKFMEGI